MENNSNHSPYLQFNREQWSSLRSDTPLMLTEDELSQLRGILEPVSMNEVVEIYLPLARLLSYYINGTQVLHQTTQQFLEHQGAKVPYIIGVSGSVAVGKSVSSRLLSVLLSRWPEHRNVVLVNTDGFLYSNKELEQRDLSLRKGFPESYDTKKLLTFLLKLKGGEHHLKVPLYSHHYYDVLPNEFLEVDQPDIVIIEGLNLLQGASLEFKQAPRHFVSDFVDFNIYVDADCQTIKQWFVQRFMLFRENVAKDPKAFLHQFWRLSPEEAYKFAERVWDSINEINLIENILPFKERADLILTKAEDHSVHEVYLRKL